MSEDNVINSLEDYLWPLPTEKTAPEYLLRRVSQHVQAGRKECITDAVSGRTINYDDIEPLSKNIASGLCKLGFKKGDTLIYSTHDAARVHLLFLGVWRANGIVRSSYPEDFGETLVERIEESGAQWIACDSQYAAENLEVTKMIPWSVKIFVFGEPVDRCIPAGTLFEDIGDACPALQVGPEDMALVLPTSGTTGKSKGACYNHKSLIDNILAYEYLPFTDKPEEPTIITSKQTHYIGSVCGLAFIAHGRRLVMMQSANVENILKAVSKYKVRAIMGFPKYLVALIIDPIAKNYDISSIRYLSTAGQLVVPETAATIYKLKNLQSFMVVYGMTECGLLTSSANWNALKDNQFRSLDELRPFSVGKLPPRTSLKVRDIETGEFVGAGQKGELYFKTPLVSNGYKDRPKESKETFEDGWIRTGDVGYYDADGYVYIVDRYKEIFKYFNNHISPSELENILLRHPSVSEAVCCGVPDPDGGDFIPRAFVVLKPEPKATVDEIKQFLDSQVPSYKRLRGGLYILPEIPVGKTGKVTRKLMADLPV